MTNQPFVNPHHYRACVGIMIINQKNEVLIAKRKDLKANASHAWQMPQGGIDLQESPHQAALREMGEEIGTKNVKLLGQAKEWIYYDFPEAIRQTSSFKAFKGQRQMWFLFQFDGVDTDINLETAHPEFCEWRWADKEEVLAQIVPFKREAYQQVFAEFSNFFDKYT